MPRAALGVAILLALPGCKERPGELPASLPPPIELGEPAHPDPPITTQTGPAAPISAVEARAACPPEMVLVEGDYCPKVEHRCLRYLDKSGKFKRARCAEYEPKARCLSPKKRRLSFCIDRDEQVAKESSLPLTGRTLPQAARICAAAGKRLCRESEWNFACEGEEMRPYPYGWNRDPAACNADKKTIVGKGGTMVSLAAPPGSYPACTSPFGVRDMTGNVEEWVQREDYPNRGAMKGAYWLPTSNHCRAAQRIHGPLYSGLELGFRCCAAPSPAGQ
jgi:formylglycine-generating enzyme